MRTEIELPEQFACLAGQVKYVQQHSHSEYSSSCPRCGGSPHPSGEWPDRFRMFSNGRPRVWCRRCGFFAFVDSLTKGYKASAEEIERFRREQEQRAEARLRSAQRELELLRSSKLWLHYNEMLGEHERAWWRGRGVPDVWQDLWELGWSHERQAASIPIKDDTGQCRNIKYRTVDGQPRYYYHLSGVPAMPFLTDPELKDPSHIIAVEGEIKAMVVYIAWDNPNGCVVGLPGLNPSPSVIETLSKAEKVTLVLDPGADTPGENGWSPLGRLVQQMRSLNPKGRYLKLIPPVKVDDGILAAGLDKHEVNQLLRSAVKV